MKYDSEKHHRHSIRLRGYDYSKSGTYFITICTNSRQCLLGRTADGKMVLNDGGKIIEKYWLEIPQHFPHAQPDEFVVMPNHVHGIVVLLEPNNTPENVGANVGAKDISPLRKSRINDISQPRKPRGTSKTIGSIVRGFKIGVTKWFRQNTDICIVWQRNYYEHIVRSDDELNRIRKYIINNPANWKNDKNYV